MAVYISVRVCVYIAICESAPCVVCMWCIDIICMCMKCMCACCFRDSLGSIESWPMGRCNQ
jgi:hypothetical protein